MKRDLAQLGALLLLCGSVFVAQLACRSRDACTRCPKSYEFACVQPCASPYWIEWNETEGGRICSATGQWNIDDRIASKAHAPSYHGESAFVRSVKLPGLGRSFLIFTSVYGAYTTRWIIFDVAQDRSLNRCADVISVWELSSDPEDVERLRHVFRDVDGDGREEFAEGHREWVTDDKGDVIDDWAVRTTYHVWNGERFVPQYTQLLAAGSQGPLVELQAPHQDIVVENDDHVTIRGEGESWFHANGYSYRQSVDFMAELQKRLCARDREAIANAVCFPLRVNGQVQILVKDRAQFTRQFDLIFTPEVVKAVLAADARKVSCNYQGIMLGQGVVWAKKKAEGECGLCAINQ